MRREEEPAATPETIALLFRGGVVPVEQLTLSLVPEVDSWSAKARFAHLTQEADTRHYTRRRGLADGKKQQGVAGCRAQPNSANGRDECGRT